MPPPPLNMEIVRFRILISRERRLESAPLSCKRKALECKRCHSHIARRTRPVLGRRSRCQLERPGRGAEGSEDQERLKRNPDAFLLSDSFSSANSKAAASAELKKGRNSSVHTNNKGHFCCTTHYDYYYYFHRSSDGREGRAGINHVVNQGWGGGV